MAAVEAAATRVLGLCQSNRGPGALGPCVERRGEAWSRRARSRSRSRARARARVQSSRLPASGVASVASVAGVASSPAGAGGPWLVIVHCAERAPIAAASRRQLQLGGLSGGGARPC
jgi:hypothetical protein